MNVVERAKDGYGRSAVHMKSPRDTEYEAIARISHRLRASALERKTNFAEFAEALHQNARLWTTLASDVSQAENSLPRDLKARLFWLAEFTLAETQKILTGKADVDILIEINASVLQGLRARDTDQ